MGVLSNNDMGELRLQLPESSHNAVARLVRQPWLWCILLLAAGVRFYGFTASAIWCDEGSSLMLSAYPLAEIWSHASHDVHPPLYFMLLHGWMAMFGDSLASIRSLSVLPGIVTVMLGMWLVRLVATQRAALLAGLLLALLPTAVRYSQEVRMYALLGVWLIAATIALVYWIKAPHSYRYPLIYTLLMAAAFYTHYFTAFCVIAHWLYLLLCGRATRWLIKRPAWWLANVAIVLLFLPWLPGLVDLLQHMAELKSGGDVGWEPTVDARSLPAMLWQLLTQDEGDSLPWPLFWLPPLALLGSMVWMALRDATPHKFTSLIVIYTLLPILAIYAVSFASPLFIERYVMFAALGLPLLVAIAVDRLLTHKRALAIAILALFIGTEAVGLRSNFSSDADHFDRLVEHVNQQFKPGDRIVVSDLFWYFSFVYYNKTGFEPMLYTPPLEDGTSGRPNDYGFGTLVNGHGQTIYVDRLSDLPPGSGRVWLISSKVQPDDFSSIPVAWHKARDLSVDDTQARLYLTCPGAECGAEPEWSQLDAKAHP
ncbi:glycosyltransferase family 39 protein [Pseudomonas sp. WC2401]